MSVGGLASKYKLNSTVMIFTQMGFMSLMKVSIWVKIVNICKLIYNNNIAK